jgi:hypothetical protein
MTQTWTIVIGEADLLELISKLQTTSTRIVMTHSDTFVGWLVKATGEYPEGLRAGLPGVSYDEWREGL